MTELDYYKALQTLNVLYCEDEEEPRKQMKMILEDSVRKLYVAKDGLEGLEIYKANKIDLIVTDIKMPKMDGLLMTEKIREFDKKIQIILLTAFDYKNFFQRAIDAGVGQYVIKPISENKLFKSISRAVETIMAQKKVDYQSMFIQNILDAQKNLVLVTDGKYIQAVNRSFLDFFRYEKLHELIVDKMEKIEKKVKFTENGEYIAAKDLIETFNNYSQQKTVIYIQKDGEDIAFSCEISKLEEIKGRFLITLTNLSGFEEMLEVTKPEVVATPLVVQEETKELEEDMQESDNLEDDEILEFDDELSFDDKLEEEQKQKDCLHDPLTNYYNLGGFYENLDNFLDKKDANYSLLLFTFSSFKEINRRRGFKFGDGVIEELTQIYKDEFTFDGLFVRFCGVEFGLLISYEESQRSALRKLIRELNEKIDRTLREYSSAAKLEVSHFKVDREEIFDIINKIRTKHALEKGS